MDELVSKVATGLFNKQVFGYVTLDFISFKDPFGTDGSPLFWANGISTYYTNFNSVSALINASLSTNLRGGIEDDQARSVVCFPFISQPSLPSSNFKSFFHLSRLGNLFYDVQNKKGVMFLVADSL